MGTIFSFAIVCIFVFSTGTINFVDVEGMQNVKRMISLLAITGQFIPQNRCGAEWQETDVWEYIRSADVISVFSIVLMV